MQLKQLKQSILQIPNEEAIALHKAIRKNRMVSKRAAKVAVQKQTKLEKTILADQNKIRKVLELLGYAQ